MTMVGEFEIGPIDFDAIVDLFFWDTVYLAGEDMTKLTAKE